MEPLQADIAEIKGLLVRNLEGLWQEDRVLFRLTLELIMREVHHSTLADWLFDLSTMLICGKRLTEDQRRK